MTEPIVNFFGEYRWLSNFWNAPLVFPEITFPNVECAYQALKSENPEDWLMFTNISASTARKRGKLLPLRPDWNDAFKLRLMYQLVYKKFHDHPDLKGKLLNTGDAELIEGNHWGDTYWGVSQGQGTNYLGRILMQVRKDLGGS